MQNNLNPSVPQETLFSRRTFLRRDRPRHRGLRLAARIVLMPRIRPPPRPLSKAQPAGEDLIASIERSVLWNGRKSGKSWFHPRACLIPPAKGADTPVVFMTLQEITGSDNFGQVHWTVTSDLGRTWRTPEPIPAFARSPIDGGLEEGVCDVVPQFHPPTGVVLAMGHNVYYKAGKLTKPQEDRFPVYAVRTPDGRWSERKQLRWDDPRGSGIYTCGSSERLLLDNGDVLVAISFVERGQVNRKVTSFRCTFDGKNSP